MISQMISWSVLSRVLTFTLQDLIAVHFQGRSLLCVRMSENKQSENVSSSGSLPTQFQACWLHSLVQSATCLLHLHSECTEHTVGRPAQEPPVVKAGLHKRQHLQGQAPAVWWPFSWLCFVYRAFRPNALLQTRCYPKRSCRCLHRLPLCFSSWRPLTRASTQCPYGCFCFCVSFCFCFPFHKGIWPQPAGCPAASSPFFLLPLPEEQLWSELGAAPSCASWTVSTTLYLVPERVPACTQTLLQPALMALEEQGGNSIEISMKVTLNLMIWWENWNEFEKAKKIYGKKYLIYIRCNSSKLFGTTLFVF